MHNATSEAIVTIEAPSPPIIISLIEDLYLKWGDENIVFSWEVHGGTTWELYRNGTILQQEILAGHFIEYGIHNWHQGNWIPGIYNLSLSVSDDTVSTTLTTWIEVGLDFGDIYADAVVEAYSHYYIHGENAIDAPDNQFATIYLDYDNGRMMLDMGLGEEILDGSGVDFEVIAQGGEYAVSVSNEIGLSFQTIATASGNSSFDLDSIGYSEARYVIIECRTDNVELDAIVALHYNIPRFDTISPQIEEIEDFWVWENTTSIFLSWNAYDATPWSFEIWVNGSILDSGFWDGSIIFYIFSPASTGVWNVTLVTQDAFGNSAQSDVLIEVRPFQNPTSNGFDPLGVLALTAGSAVLIVILYMVYTKRLRK